MAYADESGKHETARAFCLVAIAGAPSGWDRVRQQWPKLLRQRHVLFHASDAENLKGSQFCSWSRADVEATQADLVRIINGNRLVCHAVFVDRRRYRELEDRFRNWRQKYSSPYFLVFQHALESVRNESDDPVRFVFDRQDEFSGRAREIYLSIQGSSLPFSDKLAGLEFKDKVSTVALQLADYVAYEFYRHVIGARLSLEPRNRWQWTSLDPSLIRERGFKGKQLKALLDT